jgi:hypothetical protein
LELRDGRGGCCTAIQPKVEDRIAIEITGLARTTDSEGAKASRSLRSTGSALTAGY